MSTSMLPYHFTFPRCLLAWNLLLLASIVFYLPIDLEKRNLPLYRNGTITQASKVCSGQYTVLMRGTAVWVRIHSLSASYLVQP